MVIFASFNYTMHFECEITWTLDRIYSAYTAYMLVTIFWILSSKGQRSRLQLFGRSRILSTCNHHSLSFIRNSKIRIEIPKAFKSSATLITPRIWTGLLVLVPTNGAAGWIRSTLPWFSLIHCVLAGKHPLLIVPETVEVRVWRMPRRMLVPAQCSIPTTERAYSCLYIMIFDSFCSLRFVTLRWLRSVL